jgi:4-amino-4-deoxy-L-arabinose transferase-like glycosyltransferase
MVVRNHNQSWQQMLTPKWGENYWGYDPNSYDLDNFPGQMILGIAVTKLGTPPEQALHILGMLFQVLSIFLLVEIAKQFSSLETASTLYYALLLTPMAFAYNIRANHELGIMFFSILSLYAGLRLPFSKYWGIVTALASVMLLWIKGPFFIFGLILTGLGYFSTVNNYKKLWPLVMTLILSLIVIISSALYFDHLYESLTGVKFLLGFWKIQIAGRQIPSTSQFSFITLKIYNLYYYSWHYMAYALPWILFLLVNLTKNKKDFISFLKSKLSICFLLAALSFVLVFTVNSRHAARYVFPGYYLFSAWCILALYSLEPRFQKLHQKISAQGLHFIAPILWLLIFSLHFI